MPGIARPQSPDRTTGIALIDRSSSAEVGRFIRAFALLWSISAIPFLMFGSLEVGDTFALLSFIVLPAFYVARRELDFIGLMAAMAFFLVAYVPAVSLYAGGDARAVKVMIAVLPWLAAAEAISRRIGRETRPSRSFAPRAELLMLAGWLVMAMATSLALGGKTTNPAFLGFYALALFHFDRLCRTGQLRVLGLALFSGAIIFYAALLWDYYGRLLFGGLVAMPVLILMCHLPRRPGPLLISAFLPVMIAISQWVRDDEISAGGISGSSMASPSEIGVQLMQAMDHVAVKWPVFWDQLSFFYLSWVPRALWHDKPLGLGLTIVDDLQGRRGMSAFHSEAPGIVGEALWTFGPYVFVGLVVSLIAYLSISLLIRLTVQGNRSPYVIQAALLPTLVWGGMASFSARLWLLLLPLLIYAVLVALIEQRQLRKVPA